MAKNKLVKGALVLSLGGIITKVIGAVYRVPLTNILGAEGIGIYQMVFPLYAILLTFSSTGVPSGISKLIADGENPQKVLKSSIVLFSGLGLILGLLMAVFSRKIAIFQGDKNAYLAYLFISPAVVFVSLISCFRGYFQGIFNMSPTAVSQVIEQVTKLFFGLIICYFLRNDVIKASAGATLAVTLSEVVALFYLIKKSKKDLSIARIFKQKIAFKPIVKNVLPIMATTLIMPIIKMVDSFLILNVVGSYLTNATAYYGLYSGAVESIVSLPVSVCYAIAVTSIPIVSKAKKENEDLKKHFKKSIYLTVFTAIILSAVTLLFSNFSINLLYKGLSESERLTAGNMLKLSSLTVIFLPIMQTSIALINAIGKYKVSLFSGSVMAIVKIISSYLLLKNPSINVYGAILSDILSYFVACFINLSYIIYSVTTKNKIKTQVKVQNV